MKSITRGLGLHQRLGLAVLAVVLGAVVGTGTLPVSGVSAQAFGTVTIQKQLVLPGPGLQAAPAGDLSGFTFTLTPSVGGTPVTLTTNAMGQAQVGVAPGNYTIAEAPRPGTTLRGFAIGGTTIQSFAVSGGQTVAITATNEVAGTGQITVQKQIVDANNQPIAGADASGFAFAVAGPNGFASTLTTGANGTVTFANLGAGNYTVTEAPRSGFTYVASAVDGVPVANGQAFPVAAAQSRQVVFQNRQGTATGTVAITKQIVDASGNIVANANRGGIAFSITCGGQTLNGTTDANGNITINNVPAGSCQLNEAVGSGFTFVSATPQGGTAVTTNPGAITVTSGQTLNLVVTNRQAPAAVDVVQLPTGCSNVALTWPAGTSLSVVAAAVSPPGTLESIFLLDAALGRFRGFSPLPNAPNDYVMTGTSLEAVFICMRSPGTLSRPAR